MSAGAEAGATVERFGLTTGAGAADVPMRCAKRASLGGKGSSKGRVKRGESHLEKEEGGS